MIKFSIIVPCYNEEKNIPLLINKFEKVITTNEIELILVENGSSDNSKKILEILTKNHPFAKMVIVPVNKGYGYGIKQGLSVASGKFIGYTHADLQTDPNDLIKAIEIVKLNNFNENILIKGRRKGRPFSDRFFTFGMSFFESIFLRKKLIDINAQPTFFSNVFYKKLENIPNDFSLDLYLLYTAQISNQKVVRFNVFFPPRIHGESSWNTGIKSKYKFIKRTLLFSFKLKKEIHGNNIS
jgi:glycosyltransferase involved in cell wall biosynthesis